MNSGRGESIDEGVLVRRGCCEGGVTRVSGVDGVEGERGAAVLLVDGSESSFKRTGVRGASSMPIRDMWWRLNQVEKEG